MFNLDIDSKHLKARKASLEVPPWGQDELDVSFVTGAEEAAMDIVSFLQGRLRSRFQLSFAAPPASVTLSPPASAGAFSASLGAAHSPAAVSRAARPNMSSGASVPREVRDEPQTIPLLQRLEQLIAKLNSRLERVENLTYSVKDLVAKKNQGYERLKKKLEGLQKGKVAVDDIESAKQAEVDQHELEEESEEEDEEESEEDEEEEDPSQKKKKKKKKPKKNELPPASSQKKYTASLA